MSYEALAPTDVFPNIATDNAYMTVDRKMAANLPGVFAAGEGLVAGQSAATYIAELIRKAS